MGVKSSIGQLRQVVKFERNEPVQLGAGRRDNYVEMVTCRGKLTKKRSSRDQDLADALLRGGWTCEVRFQAGIENYIGKSIRLVIDNMFFTPTGYELIDQKRHRYLLHLNEAQ